MISDADRAKYALPEKPRTGNSNIEKADSLIDIRDVLQMMNKTKEYNVWFPTGDFDSYKIFCPWAYEHADGGADKNCRIYGTNNIYCFGMHDRITTSSLYARWKGMPRHKAAEILLEQYGLLHQSWRDRWNDLVILREDRQHVKLGSQNEIIGALHTLLAQDAAYVENEFAPEVRAAWQVVLSALDKVWDHPDTNLEILQQWFNRSLTRLLTSAKLRETDGH